MTRPAGDIIERLAAVNPVPATASEDVDEEGERLLARILALPPSGHQASVLRPLRRLRGGRLALALALAGLAVVVSVPALAVIQGWWFLGSGSPKPVGAIVTIVPGRSAGIPWKFSAYRSQTGLCVVLTPEPPRGRPGGAAGCGFGVRGELVGPSSGPRTTHSVGYVATYVATSSSSANNFPPFVFGPTAEDVRRVEIVLSNGRTIHTSTRPAPRELGTRVRFYIAELPENVLVRAVVARSAGGKLAERLVVPKPRKGQPPLQGKRTR